MAADGAEPGPGVALDLTLVVMYGGRSAVERGAVPTIVSLWADPRWTGVWARACAEGVRGALAYAVFRVGATLRPLRPSSMQRAGGAAGPARTLCNSLKLHFFMPTRAVPEFRFGSACALAALGGGPAMLGVWNSCDEPCLRDGVPMRGWLLAAHGPVAVPREVALRGGPCPDPAFYRRVSELGDWLFAVLRRHYGACESQFLNPVAGCRDGWLACMFHDLPRLYDEPGGSPLPPLLALYLMAGALAVQGLSPADFLDAAARAPDDQAAADAVAGVVRQGVCGFAACEREGLYFADQSVGREQDDEQFPLGFRPPRALCGGGGGAFFQEDDCEGRVAQIKALVALLLGLARDARAHGSRWARAHLRRYAAQAARVLQVRPETLDALLRCCVRAGELLLDGGMQVLMGMGDGALGRFDGSGRPGVCPHAFALLLYDGGRGVRVCMVLEGTGWTGADAEPPRAAAAEALRREAIDFTPMGARRRRGMAREDEDQFYTRVLLGDGRMFWTCPGGGQCPEVGASPRGLRGGVRPYSPEAWRGAAAGQVLTTGLGDWMRLLAAGGDGPWAAVPGAGRAAEDYAAVSAACAGMGAGLRPPPDREGVLVRRMEALFGPILEADLPTGARGPPDGAFSYLAADGRPGGEPPLVSRWRARGGVAVRTLRFLQSVVVLAHAQGPGLPRASGG